MKTNQICLYPSVTVAIEFITPAFAMAALETNPDHQRKISSANLEKIQNDMENGRFHLTGEAIIFGKSKRMLEGQHRCLGCVNSKHGFWSVVVRGVDDELFHLINTGKTRTLADVLTIAGRKDVAVLAATILRMAEYIKGPHLIGGAVKAISYSEAMDTLQMNPSLPDSIAAVRPGGEIVAPSRIAWFHCIVNGERPDLAPSFFSQLFSGEMISAKSPVYLLRARLISDRSSKSRLPLREVLALLVKAWNAYVKNETPKILKWSKDEAFPALLFK